VALTSFGQARRVIYGSRRAASKGRKPAIATFVLGRSADLLSVINRIALSGKSAKSCQVWQIKIFCFSESANQVYNPRYPAPHKGAFRDRHERRCGMQWMRAAL
jgi:hypothetical protein